VVLVELIVGARGFGIHAVLPVGESMLDYIGCTRMTQRGGVLKYGGRMIHRVVDDHGPIEVIEAHGVRSLHFGSPARQSAMDLAAPDRIELTYLRSLLTPLLFAPEPRRILLLGLGGGTLARFLLHHFPGVEIEAVELRAQVVEIAKTYFKLEAPSSLCIHVMDAHHYLERPVIGAHSVFDLILVDVFDAEGPSVILDEPEFFSRLSGMLAPRGGMAVNLWSGEGTAWREVQAEIRHHFKGPLAGLSVPGRGNRICLALGEAFGKLNFKTLEETARTLEQRLGVEFVRLLERLEFSPSR
jgi:spermidine synthase